MDCQALLARIRADDRCRVLPSVGLPLVPDDVQLPGDLKAIFEATGGIALFGDEPYGIDIVAPPRFVRANPVIVGDACPEDISHDWFILAQHGRQYITVDLNPRRLGRCYDSFWDRHGVAGSCPILALGVSELLEKLYAAKGRFLFWLTPGFRSLGDAYDEQYGPGQRAAGEIR